MSAGEKRYIRARKWLISELFRVVTILRESLVCFYENIYTEKTVGGFRLWIRCFGGSELCGF